MSEKKNLHTTVGQHKQPQTNIDGQMKPEPPLCHRRPGIDPQFSQLLRSESESVHATQLVVKRHYSVIPVEPKPALLVLMG